MSSSSSGPATSGDKTTDMKRDAKEMLLKEYDSLSESIWRNEATGETRVNWFLGIVAVGIGGLLKLVTSQERPHGIVLGTLLFGCLSGLFAFGFVTLHRIIQRNNRTDRMIQDLDTIRQIFRDQFDEHQILCRFHPFGRSHLRDGKISFRRRTPRRFGGLADLVLTINAILAGGLAFTILFFGADFDSSITLGPAIVICAVALIVSFLVLWWQYCLVRFSDPTHAGGVVYRDAGNHVEYLLVRPKRKEVDEWVLPKGHIEPAEHEEQAAEREVTEETGVTARIVRPLRRVRFRAKGEPVRAKFFLMKQISATNAEESDARDPHWFPFSQAVSKATHRQSKRLIKLAESWLRKNVGDGGKTNRRQIQ